jgi:hypothetical protein
MAIANRRIQSGWRNSIANDLTDAHSYSNRDCDSNGNRHSYCNSNVDAKIDTYAETSPNASASPVGILSQSYS